jgi:poly-gamma-glutamate capsule biosynthesis protein CapA/YwtB (metallophosphatase superfamily)
MNWATKYRKENSMRHIFKTAIMMFAMAAATAAIAVGCASSPPLRTEASSSGIRAAEEVGAAKVPQASLHLQLAKEELENAKRLAANDEKERAVSMLSRAEVDAELAVALSREDAERAEAQAAVDRARQLRLENKQ